MRKRALNLAACLAIAAGGTGLAACGGSDEEEPASGGAAATETTAPAESPAAAQASGDTVEIGMKDIKFVPEQATVKVGQTVKWTNQEPVPHNVVAEDGADFKSDNLEEGDTFEYKAEKAGVINYVCTIHPGQKGSLTVE